MSNGHFLSEFIKKEVCEMHPVIALSDIHGQLLVFPALAKLRLKYPEAEVVFLGDYQDSFHHHTGVSVAQKIQAMQVANPNKIFAIQGNHDAAAWESLTGQNEYWLEMGGEDIIAETMAIEGRSPADMTEAITMFKHEHVGLFDWIGALPLNIQIGKLFFVHAGLELSLADPIEDTLPHNKYWLREDYWYGKNAPNYAHNPLDCAIVTGHTPTGLITGLYDGSAAATTLRNRTVSPRGVLTVQYENEYARFFIDGGNHSSTAAHIGNIAVFDADNGTLLEAIEDN